MPNQFSADNFYAIGLRLAELESERAVATLDVKSRDRFYCEMCGARDRADVPNKCHGACRPST